MATETETDASTFPAVDVEKELNPTKNNSFEIDSVSSDIDVSKQLEEREAKVECKKERKKGCGMQNFKTTLLVSAVIVAVAGAAFAITKKLKEKST